MSHPLLRLACAVLGAVAVLALTSRAAPTAQAQDPGVAQVVVPCPVPEAPTGIEVCIDRGPGSTYVVGDPIEICVTVNIPQITIFPPPPPPIVRLTSIVNRQTRQVIFEERFASGQRCIRRVIGPPLGQEAILGEVIEPNGRVFATNTVNFRSVPAQPSGPAAPSNLTATALDSTRVRLDWVDNSNDEAGFRIFDGFTPIGTVSANVRTFTVTGLEPNSYHCFRVVAFAANGTESPSTDWACIVTPPTSPPGPPPPPPPPLAAPSNPRATALSANSIRIDWVDTSRTEAGFRIFNGFTPIGTVGANVTSFVATGLPPSSWNCFRVQAFSGSTTSLSSDWACTFTLPGGNVPIAPANLRATPVGGGFIRLDWVDRSFNEDGFIIVNGGTQVGVVGPNVTTFFDGGLPIGSWNCYYVRAFNSAGESATTDWACAVAER